MGDVKEQHRHETRFLIGQWLIEIMSVGIALPAESSFVQVDIQTEIFTLFQL